MDEVAACKANLLCQSARDGVLLPLLIQLSTNAHAQRRQMIASVLWWLTSMRKERLSVPYLPTSQALVALIM